MDGILRQQLGTAAPGGGEHCGGALRPAQQFREWHGKRVRNPRHYKEAGIALTTLDSTHVREIDLSLKR